MNPSIVSSHPIWQQEISSIIFLRAVAPAVRPVRVAIPLLDGPFVRSQDLRQLRTAKPILFSLRAKVDSVRIVNWPFDQIHWNALKSQSRFLRNLSSHAPSPACHGDVIPKRVFIRPHLAPGEPQSIQKNFPKSWIALVAQ